MKSLLFLLLFFSTALLRAQETSKVTPPVIVAKVALGKTVVFEDTSVTFSKVIEDSRCPIDVICVWAGQAKVLITIKSDDTTSEKELIFHGFNFGSENENTLFVSETNTFIGYRLSPYPASNMSSAERKYQLEVFIK